MSKFKINNLKYTSSLTLSLIGSEAFKLGSSIFIFKFTGNLWLVTFLYLLLQLPSVLVYLFSSEIVKKVKSDKLILLICDLLSFAILIPPLITFIILNKDDSNNDLKTTLSIILITFSTLLGFIHSFRFIFLKNIIYFIADNNDQMQKFNATNSLATSLGFIASTILSFFLFKNLSFYWLITMNMITYLVSGILYYSLKVNKEATVFSAPTSTGDVENKQDKSNLAKSWMFILSGSLLIGIFLFPNTSGLSQYFNSFGNSEYKIDNWGFYFSIIFATFSLIGVVIVYFFQSKIKKSKPLFIAIIAVLGTLNFVWLFFINSEAKVNLISYVSIIALQQFTYSLFISIYYSTSYELFSKSHFHKQNGIAIVFRILLSSMISVLFTLISTKAGYLYTYLFYSLIVFICATGILVSSLTYKKRKDKIQSKHN